MQFKSLFANSIYFCHVQLFLDLAYSLFRSSISMDSILVLEKPQTLFLNLVTFQPMQQMGGDRTGQGHSCFYERLNFKSLRDIWLPLRKELIEVTALYDRR